QTVKDLGEISKHNKASNTKPGSTNRNGRQWRKLNQISQTTAQQTCHKCSMRHSRGERYPAKGKRCRSYNKFDMSQMKHEA
ncbi:hypothetical protein ACJMK2_044365, partial [Sinanodonta woodiana]